MVGWRLLLCGRRGKEGFRVGGEVVAAVGAVEAFGKDYYVCAGRGG